jgi:hypothetical protein
VIGVIAKAGQAPAVEEFFQLFKTPWEVFQPGRTYDVVVVTASEVPEVDAGLLVIYGAGLKATDARDGLVPRSRKQGGSMRYRSLQLPVYGEVFIFEEREAAIPCVWTGPEIAGFRFTTENLTVVRLGYDLFDEVSHLLSVGQPVDNAHIPTLDIHVVMLREWIVGAGIPLLEIPPVPAGYSFAVSLTHDIDFGGVRSHRFDHTMWGFLYRSTIGAVRNLLRGRLSVSKLLQSWCAAASLPFVLVGWARDFWEPFGWYLKVERGLPATYFVIPFKRRPGDKVTAPHASRRAAGYDLSDLTDGTTTLLKEGCELAVHGIDAWHSVERGRDELKRIAEVNGEFSIGVRMHWLLRDQGTFAVLERAGFAYDSTVGYNETVGYRSGTTQVFRPLGARMLLELPLHIQDGALLYPERLDLSESEAWNRCKTLIDHAREFGGVLTTLWHDRSPGPERFWGDLYVQLVDALKSLDGWFATAGHVVGWFRKRREVHFERVEGSDGVARTRLRYQGEEILPPLTVRTHRTGSTCVDIPWGGAAELDLDASLRSPAPTATVGSPR